MQQRILLIATIILSLGVGIFAGMIITKKAVPQGALNNADNTYQSGWDAAMKTLKDTGSLPQFPEGMEVKSINGTVEAISGNTITLKVTTPGLIGAPALLTRTVSVDSNTKIMQLVQKDPAQLQKDFEAFDETLKQQIGTTVDPANVPLPPSAQDKKDANLGDLKVGQMIMIQAAEDIKDKQQFVATEIQIQQNLQIPASLPQEPVSSASAPAPMVPTAIDQVSTPTAPVAPAPAPDPKNLPVPPVVN